jgi:xanthine dehydrogenase YagT iron-sulfur-binding subunit
LENKPDAASPDEKKGSTRREFLEQVSAIGVGATLSTSLKSVQIPTHSRYFQEEGTIQVSLFINDKKTTLELDPRVTLLDALREKLHFTGTKKRL